MAFEKNDRFAEKTARAVAEYIQSMDRPPGLLSVTRCDFSKHAGRATISIRVYPEKNEQAMLSYLSERAYEIQKEVGRLSKRRITPRLIFEIDRRGKEQEYIDSVIDKSEKN